MDLALLTAALLIGCLLAVQASANIQLNAAVGTPYGAATLQLAVAAGLLAVLAIAVGALGALGRLPDVPLWYLLGGLASPLYITSGILLFPRLGALVAVGLFVTGQMFASLALDLFGLLGLARQDATPALVVGALGVLAGIVVIVRGQQGRQDPSGPRTGRTGSAGQPGWLALGLLAGAALPVQGAVNARLRSGLDEPIAAALTSFGVATLSIAVVLLVLSATHRTPRPRIAPLSAMPWWGWLGGACAAVYVTGTFLLIPAIGAAVTVALTVTGQQLTSAVIDQRGLFRLRRRALTTPRLAGLVLLLSGSLLVQLG